MLSRTWNFFLIQR